MAVNRNVCSVQEKNLQQFSVRFQALNTLKTEMAVFWYPLIQLFCQLRQNQYLINYLTGISNQIHCPICSYNIRSCCKRVTYFLKLNNDHIPKLLVANTTTQVIKIVLSVMYDLYFYYANHLRPLKVKSEEIFDD